MSNTNLDIKEAFQDTQLEGWVNDLGHAKDPSWHATQWFKYTLTHSPDIKPEKNAQDQERFVNEYNFATQRVLEAATYNPQSPEEVTDSETNPYIKRTRALVLLMEAYPIIVEQNPEFAIQITDLLNQKISNPLKTTMILCRDEGTNQFAKNETYIILQSLKIIAEQIPYQPESITKKLFSTMVEATKTDDYLIICEYLRESIFLFLKNSASKEHPELFNSLIDILVEKVNTTEVNTENKKTRFNDLGFLCSYVFSPYLELPNNLKLRNYKQVYTAINKIIRNETLPDEMRSSYLHSFYMIKDNWNKDPQLLKQDLSFHSEIFSTLVDIVRKNKEKEKSQLFDEAYQLLGYYLTSYVEGITSNDYNWRKFEEKYHKKMNTCLNIYLANIEKGNKHNQDILSFAQKIISPELIKEKNYPFKKEATDFINRYLKELVTSF
jgi:hypothetical protein